MTILNGSEIRREYFPPYLSNMERLDELFELIIQRLMQLFLRDCAAKFFAAFLGTAAVTSVINPAIPRAYQIQIYGVRQL